MATPITLSAINTELCPYEGYAAINRQLMLIQNFMDTIQTYPDDYDPNDQYTKWVFTLGENCKFEWVRFCDCIYNCA